MSYLDSLKDITFIKKIGYCRPQSTEFKGNALVFIIGTRSEKEKFLIFLSKVV